jgi:hypothetical protein
MLRDEERKREQQNKKQKRVRREKHQFACFGILFFPSHLISALATCLQSE